MFGLVFAFLCVAGDLDADTTDVRLSGGVSAHNRPQFTQFFRNQTSMLAHRGERLPRVLPIRDLTCFGKSIKRNGSDQSWTRNLAGATRC